VQALRHAGHVNQLVSHDRWRADQAMQRRLVENHDGVRRVWRVEDCLPLQPGNHHLLGGKQDWSGAVLVLTNDPGYWSRPNHGRATNADAFRIYENQNLSGKRAWGPVTGAGTMKARESAIELRGTYTCRWSDYSALPGAQGRFRLLAITIDALQ
jgi:hypothetical protein